MTDGRKLDKRFLVPGLALLAVVVIGAEALSAQGRATATRNSGSSTSSGSSPSSSPGTMSRTSSGTSGARATPSGRGTSTRSSPKAVDTRQSTPAGRGRHRGATGRHSSRHHYDIGLHFGYGGYYGWGRYGGGYYYPYYYHPFYWGVPYYVPRRAYREYRLGAFDLNVRPKKAEVYLDGQFIGTAGQFDGFPDHLWLEQGSYELIFYRPGLGTERRVLSIYPGVVVDVRLRMQPGESVDPAELSDVDREPAGGAMAEVKAAYDKQQSEDRAAAPSSAELDTRSAPGRVRLSVLPADASVYLDGRLLGSGDELGRLHAGLVVEAGSHLIEVVRPGYATERREFAVEEGAEVELEVLLKAG